MMRLLLLAALTATGIGCSSMNDDQVLVNLGVETEEEYREMRAQMIAELDASIGDATATSASSCQVVEVGEKACGGPAEYRVYSTTDGDPDRIEALADEISDLDRSAITAFGLVSTCDVPVPPVPALDGGRCVAGNR